MFKKIPFLVLFSLSFLLSCQSVQNTKTESTSEDPQYREQRFVYLMNAAAKNKMSETEATEAFLLAEYFLTERKIDVAEKLLEASFRSSHLLIVGIKLASLKASQNQLGEAKEIINQLAPLYPSTPEIPLALAAISELAQNEREALHILEHAHKQYPNNLSIVLRYSEVLVRQGKASRALDILAIFIEQNPYEKLALMQIAEIFFLFKKPLQAQKYVKEYLKYDEYNDKALQLLGTIEEMLKNYKDAEECFKKAYQHNENSGENIRNYARILLIQNQYKQALEVLTSAPPALVESSEELNYLIALCYQNTGEYEKALAHLDYIDITNPFYQDSVKLKIVLNVNLNRLEEAENYLKYINLTAKTSDFEYTFKANILAAFQKYQEAIALLDEGLKLYPKSEPLALQQIFLSRKLETKKKNNQRLQEFVLEHPKNATALNMLGYFYLDGDAAMQKKGKEYIEKALVLDPTNNSYIDSLGWAYFKLHQYKQAEKHLEKILEVAPTEIATWYHLGEVFLQQQQQRKALEYFQRADELIKEQKPFDIFLDPELIEIKEKVTKRIEKLTSSANHKKAG